MPVSQKHADTVQFKLFVRVQHYQSPEVQKTQVRKPIAIRQRLRVGVCERAVRYAPRTLRREIRRFVRRHETRQGPGTFKIPQKSQFHG